MQKASKDKEKVRSSNLFPVVGVGASAGGLDAFKRFLRAIPEDSRMAYILVQHLDPAHESILAELLQKTTRIPVREITDNMQVEADHIYIIPSNKLLTATDGILQLSARPPKNQKNMPIDLFFSSLAEVHQSHAIGIILSGTGSDGTLGLKSIKDHGGIAFAQDPASAAYDAMPQSAIDAEIIDFILPPEEMPQQLLLLNRTFKVIPLTGDGIAQKEHEDIFRQILSLLRIRRGVDFTFYKQTTIRRRITRRIALNMKEDIAEYLAYLTENTAEQDTLYHDLLIPVTQFFRDPAVFQVLCEKVFPMLFKDRQGSDPFRIWIAGCSTGEEAYSMVMCLHEYLGEKAAATKIQVFATDISDGAIAKARSGIYKKTDVSSLSPARLEQFFTRIDGKYRLNKAIRESCIFAYHNFLNDPPFANIDMVSCRNSLIYVEPILQKKALNTFHYALKETGVLVLGKSEAIGQAADLYNVFDKACKIYTRKAVRGKILHVIPDRREGLFRAQHTIGGSESIKDNFQKNADDILLARYAPPGVVVNSDMDIVQFRGATGMWLEPSPGKPNLNVLKMAREGLAFELRNALHKARITKKTQVKEDILIEFMGAERLVTLEVIPLLNTIELHFLILFRDAVMPQLTAQQQEENRVVALYPKKNRDQQRIRELQKELALAREDMRSITDDQESSNQDLQSANEELLSGSEELQSLNEELETSKEEIQTSNEELLIVNQELSDRNEQLNHSRLYAESIVTTIREPLIILSKDFVVKSANRAFYAKFQTTEERTEGKVLFDIGFRQWDIPELRAMLEKILPDRLNMIDFEVKCSFPPLGERIMLLNASRIFRDNSEEQSILLAIEDITEERKVDKELELFAEALEKQVLERTYSLHQANMGLRHSNENLEQFAYIASHDLQEPLRKIRTFSTLLQDKYNQDFSPPARELVAKIITSSDRMSTLIQGVLNFSKILHGDAAFEQVDLNDILSEIIGDFELMIAEKKALIYRARLPVIEAISLQLNQLFFNLIANSLKFSRADVSPVITITSGLLTPAQVAAHKELSARLSYCEISFKDNGIGFKQEYAEQIFMIFHRLHGREQYSGTGIGLALCRKIVLNHNGAIAVVAHENDGALFRIILPLKQS